MDNSFLTIHVYVYFKNVGAEYNLNGYFIGKKIYKCKL